MRTLSSRIVVPLKSVRPYQVSSETVSIPAGAVGTVKEFYIARKPIIDSNNCWVGGYGDTSLVLTSGTFDNEVPAYTADEDLANGDYWIDYLTGYGRGKKKDTATSMTADYYVFIDTSNLADGGDVFGNIRFLDDIALQFGTGTDFSMGVNSADSDNLTLSRGGTLGTNNVYTVNKTNGKFSYSSSFATGGTDDYGISITQTLNDSGAPSGSDINRTLKINQVRTDVTGWDDNYHQTWQVGGTDYLTLALDSGNNGAIWESNATMGGSKTAFQFNVLNSSGFTNDTLWAVSESGTNAIRIDANFGVWTSGASLNVSGGTTDWTLSHIGSKGGLIMNPSGGDFFKVMPGNSTSGVPGQSLWVQSGTHTNITASTEAPTIDFDIDATQTWATGALALQRFGIVRQPTIAFAGASTVTAVHTMEFAGAPLAGTNANITLASNVNFASHLSGSQGSYNGLFSNVGISNGVGNVFERSAIKINGLANVSLGNQTADLTNLYNISIDAVTFESTTNTRTVTGNVASLHIENAPQEGANVSFTNPSYAILVEAGLSKLDGGIVQGQGTDIASANDATCLLDGNYFDVTGTTQINTLTAGVQAGHAITLQFDGSVTVKHATAGTGAQLQLSGGSNFSATAGDTLSLIFDGTYWRETARTAI